MKNGHFVEEIFTTSHEIDIKKVVELIKDESLKDFENIFFEKAETLDPSKVSFFALDEENEESTYLLNDVSRTIIFECLKAQNLNFLRRFSNLFACDSSWFVEYVRLGESIRTYKKQSTQVIASTCFSQIKDFPRFTRLREIWDEIALVGPQTENLKTSPIFLNLPNMTNVSQNVIFGTLSPSELMLLLRVLENYLSQPNKDNLYEHSPWDDIVWKLRILKEGFEANNGLPQEIEKFQNYITLILLERYSRGYAAGFSLFDEVKQSYGQETFSKASSDFIEWLYGQGLADFSRLD